jgi:hypothetical protein
MAPRRPRKRAKVAADCRSRVSLGGEAIALPVVVASSSFETEYSPANNAVAINIKGVLLSLGTSMTEIQAIGAMTMLRDFVGTETTAKQAFDAEGVTVIVYSILRFETSETLVTEGLLLLADMADKLSNDNHVCRALVRLDFLHRIPSLVSGQSRRSGVYCAALLFMFLARTADFHLKLKLGSDAIIKFMMSVMASDRVDELSIF